MTQLEVFGATLAVVSSIISNLGVNIQKFSHAQESQRPDDNQRPYVQRPVWWMGLLLVVAGSIGDFTAFGFATQSLVAALGGGSTLVANVFIAHFLNREALYPTDLGGVFFVILGVVVIACIAEPNVEYPLPELEKRFVRTEFVVYVVVVGVFTVSMLATIKGSVANRLKNQLLSSKRRQKQLMKQFELRIQRIERRMQVLEESIKRGDDTMKTSLALLDDTGLAAKLEQVGDIVDGVTTANRVPYYYAICSGIVGAITVLLAKCSAVMIALSIKGENQFQYGMTYVFLGGMVVCILVQTHFLNMATSLGDIMTVFPIFQAFWITFSVIGGAVFYESEKSFTPAKWALYPMALVSIAIGVGLLVQHGASTIGDSSHSPKNKNKKVKGHELALLDDAEVCLITDASMSSPLLPTDTEESDGYLHLESR
ncbi:TPA: hypothetical protein N0F65_001025 [Lagenidium giganteum]|uniref:Magnesium transporter n=1 Tax=Lagenidium giganteum TaxID=4803 RepID=A0AAV2YYF5_9STRA|nr:TPA: hypothetical protein N0F65_001025 [Lagenidium giganteum]